MGPGFESLKTYHARVAEMVYAPDSNSGIIRYVGSIPTLRTKQNGAVLKWLKRPVLKTGRRETARGFKSYQLRQNGTLAQLVERQAEDLRVHASIP